MTVYLGFLDKKNHAQPLIQKPSFMAKNKIAINNPVQAHYTVEGVQSYAPQQLKALKEREDRIMQGKDGTWAPIKTVLLSDQVIEFDEKDPLKRERAQQQNTKKIKQKPRVQSANRQRVKTNARNAVSANNQVMVKLQRQLAKKNSLQRKLQKMSQKYKQYFKDVDLKQGLKVKKNKQNSNKQQQQQDSKQEEYNGQQNTYQKQEESEQKQFQKLTKSGQNFDKTTYNRSTKIKKKNQQGNSQKRQIHQQEEQQFQVNQDLKQSRNMSLSLGFDLVRQATTYSQRLGSAIHEMFK